MWVMTTGGFVSAVQHRTDDRKVSVRSRDRDSLQCVLDAVETMWGEDVPGGVEFDVGTDYPYRVTISKESFARWVSFEAMEYITYTNFKDAVKKSRGDIWSSALMKVWAAMIGVTDAAGAAVGILAPMPDESEWEPVPYGGQQYRKKGKAGARDRDYWSAKWPD